VIKDGDTQGIFPGAYFQYEEASSSSLPVVQEQVLLK
jgi:hypothetical protein